VIPDIALALGTSYIPTKKLILELLVLIVLHEGTRPEGHRQTLVALENLSTQNKDGDTAYDFWFANMKQTLAGRGKMGSLVGASQEIRKNAGVDSSLNEYAVRRMTNGRDTGLLKTDPDSSPTCTCSMLFWMALTTSTSASIIGLNCKQLV
jgi:hypothetical protein